MMLSDWQLEVLSVLPTEPTGLTLAEIADGLLGSRGPIERGRVRQAIAAIAAVLGGVYRGRGNDEWGHFAVRTYGIRRPDVAAARRLLGGAV